MCPVGLLHAAVDHDIGRTMEVLDQRAAFKTMHDFMAPGGLMLHALPFGKCCISAQAKRPHRSESQA
jgi:hypothetical protein